MAPENDLILLLPVSIVGKIDVGRLVRELETLDEFLTQMTIREPGSPVKMPRTSRILDELISDNGLNALLENDRRRLMSFMINVKAKAPILHMSFSADPSPAFIQSIVSWIRREVHPLALVQVGLQPNMGAGCILRTTNMYFDMSLRKHFKEKREMLVQQLSALQGATQ